MNERQHSLLEGLLERINPAYHQLFKDLSEYAISLGYTPVRNKTKDYSLDFKNNKLKKTIMKLEEKEQKHEGIGYGERNIPGLRLKFFASSEYSGIFKKGIQIVIENFDGKYTGCYGCGRCQEKLQGYRFVYPGKNEVFRCGSELVSIYEFSDQDRLEIMKLMGEQAEYFTSFFNKSEE